MTSELLRCGFDAAALWVLRDNLKELDRRLAHN
jgi:hypothetical protein